MKPLLIFKFLFIVIAVTLVTAGTARAQEDSDQAIAIFNHGQDLHEKGDLAGAIAEYDKALKAFPEFPEAQYQRAIAEIGLGNITEAETSLRKAIDLRTDWSLAWGMLGDVLVRKYFAADPVGRTAAYGEADVALKKALELDPANAPAYAAMIELQLNSGASADTLRETLTKVKSLTDGKAQAAASLWAGRAAIENALNDRNAAKLSVARALEIDPKNASALMLSVDIALSDNDIERAKQIAATISKLKLDPARLNIVEARIAAAEGRTSDALALLDKTPSGTPGADQLRKQIDAATNTNTVDLEKQLAADPRNAGVLNRLCSLYRRDDPMKALDYCRRAAGIEPTNMTPAAGYAAALVQAKQFGPAAALLEKLVLIQPENRTLHANYATALFELKDYGDAAKQFEWLSVSDPKAAAPYLFLGITYDRMEEYVDSLAAYEQYLRLADPVADKLDIEKVNLRLPAVRRLVKDGKGKRKGP
ncbi:MAG: tetratricopeptide repeat protein [Acidobacteria bacterium]|nr:tetratricopeptide repeat protein [Acidobacteriota bacterium]